MNKLNGFLRSEKLLNNREEFKSKLFKSIYFPKHNPFYCMLSCEKMLTKLQHKYNILLINYLYGDENHVHCTNANKI